MVFAKKDLLRELDADELTRLRRDQIAIAYKQAFPSVFPLLGGALFVLYLFWGTPNEHKIIIWFSLVMVTLVARMVMLIRFWRNKEEQKTEGREKLFTFVMISSGGVWGCLGLFFFDSSDIVHQFFIFAMLASIGAVASGTIASLVGMAILFLALLLIPMAGILFFHGGLDYRIMGILVMALFTLLASAARRIHSNIMSALVSKILHEKAAEALALSEEHFETIFKDAPAGIFYYDSDMKVIESNAEMLRILQIKEEQMVGLDLASLPDKSIFPALNAPIHGRKGHYEGSYTTKFEKLNLWVVLQTTPMYDAKRNLIGGVAIVTDITQRVVAEEKIKHQAYFDTLTDIPNRALLHDRITQSLAHYRRHGHHLAVMFLDLDHFKSINDTLGHHVGDALLVETAKRLKAVCREEDTVARLGGDEFVILLNELGQEPHKAIAHAETVAEKIHDVLAMPFETADGESIVTHSSIGIAMASSIEQNADDLLKYADTAMYQAKKEGRNTTRFYHEQMDQWIKKRLFMENALRNAIKNEELELYYQPVIEIATKNIIGAEALLRWNHPELGMVMPDEMISIAEESGLIVPIGEWVLRQACSDFVRWRASNQKNTHMQRMAVNVSSVQFRQGDFVDKVIRIVAETGIVPSMLELELTESMIIDNYEITIQKMERLKTAGIGLSMDDFGTGYSSLAYLKRLPFTTLKIDRTFIRDIMIDRDDLALVEMILSLASILKLDVIAEGVETIDQFRFLESHGCQYFQGYLCSKPLRTSAFEALLSYELQSCGPLLPLIE